MPKIVDKVAKREEILQAALRAFAKKGFNYTKMDDVAREAGIGKGTIYEYFRSKSDLLRAAYENYLEETYRQTFAILKSARSPLEKIREIILSIIRYYSRDPAIMRVFFDFWIESTHSGQQPAIDFKKIYADYRDIAQTLLKQAQNQGQVRKNLPANTPSVLVAVIEGTFLQWIIDPDAFDMNDMAEAIVDVVLGGLRA